MAKKIIRIKETCGTLENDEPMLPLEFNLEQITPKMIKKAYKTLKLSQAEALKILQESFGKYDPDAPDLDILALIEIAYTKLTSTLTPEEVIALDAIKTAVLLEGELQ